MNILYQFNDKYAPYAGVSLTSLYENNKAAKEIRVWVVGEGLSDENIARLVATAARYDEDESASGHLNRIHDAAGDRPDTNAHKCLRTITFVDSSALIDKMKALNMPTYRGSYAANVRLFVSEFIPEDVDRLLYLDADTIVTGSLSELFDTDLKGSALGMVLDSVGENHKKDLNLSDSEGYYNSGVLLIDMNVWRRDNYTEKIVDHVKTVRAQYPSPDQDLLNVVCRGNIATLPAKYNYQPFHDAYSDKLYYKYYGKTYYYTREELDRDREDTVIYHCFRFIGEFPWDKGNVHPFTKLFDHYTGISEWCDYTKTPKEKDLVMKIEKIMYKVLPKQLFMRIFTIAHGRFYSGANAKSEKGQISKQM